MKRQRYNPGLLKRLSAMLAVIGRLVYLVQTEIKTPGCIPFQKRVWLWAHGFLGRAGVLFGIDATNWQNYLSDYCSIIKVPRINGARAAVLDTKAGFTQLLRGYAPYLPHHYGLLDHGLVVPIQAATPLYSLDDLIALCQQQERLILKPSSGGRGQGIYCCQSSPNGFLLNTTAMTASEIKHFFATLTDYVICEYVIQHQYAAAIFPEAANTIRVLTMWDYDQQTPFVAAAAHRFGRRTTLPVDNWSRGGLYCQIDLRTGIMGRGGSLARDGRLCWYEKHPDTSAPIQGVRIPHWPETVAKLLEITASLAFLPYIGWDLVVTAEGFKILEGNSHPGTDLQMHAPLLTDARVRKFYQRFRVL